MSGGDGRLFGLNSTASHTNTQIVQCGLQTGLVVAYAEALTAECQARGGLDAALEHLAGIKSSADELVAILASGKAKSDELIARMRAFGGTSLDGT